MPKPSRKVLWSSGLICCVISLVLLKYLFGSRELELVEFDPSVYPDRQLDHLYQPPLVVPVADRKILIQQNLNAYQSTKLLDINTHYKTPRLLHFIFLGDHGSPGVQFTFMDYLVIRAASYRLQPDKIYLHLNIRPLDCPLWRLIRPLVTKYILIDPVVEIFHNPVSGKAHYSDIARLQILQRCGGIYMDLDSVAVRAFPESIWNPPAGMAMGYEVQKKNHIGVSMIAAAQESVFLRRWLDSYKTFNDKRWADHTVLIAGKLALEHPKEINVLPETHFNRPFWKPYDIHLLWQTKPSTQKNMFTFSKTYACHYWGSFARGFGNITRMTPATIVNENAGIHQLLRPLLPHPYFSLSVDCDDERVDEILRIADSTREQSFGLWEFVLVNSTAKSCASERLIALPATDERFHIKRIDVPSDKALSTAALGVWMAKLDAFGAFRSSKTLEKGLEAIRDNPTLFSVHVGQESLTPLELEFAYRTTEGIERVK